MINNIFKYLLTFTSLCLIGILIMDYVILPSYVGYNNEHYLPDIRGEFIDKANYQFVELNQILQNIHRHLFQNLGGNTEHNFLALNYHLIH